MAWCPKCKSEYVNGIKVCADCGCELVDSLKEEEKEIIDYTEDIEMMAALKHAWDETKSYSEDDTVGNDGINLEFEDAEDSKPYRGRYVNNEEKAEENRTSAYTLLVVGGIGFLLVVLFFFDLLPLHRIIMNKYMLSGVMGTLFLLFIIMGCVSLRNSKIFAKKAGKENNLTLEIKKWCMDNLSKEDIDESLSFPDDTTEELKYFARFEIVKSQIKSQFVNLDEAYLDRLIDEVYPEIFEDEK